MRIVVGLLVALGLVACAGKSSRDEGDRGGGGGTGGEGGTSAGGGSAGATTTGGMSGVDCSAPADAGPCDAAMRRYAFDGAWGLCLPFIYGGCEGNTNNFPSAEECYRSCDDRGARGPSYCTQSSQCTVTSVPFLCPEARWDTVVGINAGRMCEGDCAVCGTNPDIAWFTSSCSEGHCVAFDVRETEATTCLTSSDCSLRYGVGCCESCAADRSNLVSLNGEWPALLCPEGIPPCPSPCTTDPLYPSDAYPICQNGRCAVIYELH